jgi:hypothetical protein
MNTNIGIISFFHILSLTFMACNAYEDLTCT